MCPGPLATRGCPGDRQNLLSLTRNPPSNIAIPQKGHAGAFPNVSTVPFLSPACWMSLVPQQMMGSEGTFPTAMIPAPRAGEVGGYCTGLWRVSMG